MSWKKPPVGTKINKNHPLSKGLINVWAFNEMGGNPHNLIDGGLTLINGNPDDGLNTMEWRSDGDGIHLHAAAAADRCETLEQVDPDTDWPDGSIIIGLKPTTLVTSTNYRYMGSDNMFEARIDGTAPNFPMQAELLSQHGAAGPSIIAVDEMVVIGSNWRDEGGTHNHRDFINTNMVEGGSGSSEVTTARRFAIGGSHQNLAQGLIGNVYFFYQYNRVLSDAEHISIASNPYQIFEPRRIHVPLIPDLTPPALGPTETSGAVSIGKLTSAGVSEVERIASDAAPSIAKPTTTGVAMVSSVTITDVDGDETWKDGATGLVITGTGFI